MHATIESIVRRSQSEPSKPRRAERSGGRFASPGGYTQPAGLSRRVRTAEKQLDTPYPILGYRECKCNIKYERMEATI